MRIVSLVPSWTEYLLDLGLENQVIGRTKFCVRPEKMVRSIPIIGGTKTLHIDKIEALKPDLIVANIEENDREQVEACQQFCPVLLTDVRSVESALIEAERIAAAVGKSESGARWTRQIQDAWGAARPIHSKAAYVVWKDPLMVAGDDTYINDVMRWWGIHNIGEQWNNGRYPQPPSHEWQKTNADWVLLPSEPFPFSQKHLSGFDDHLGTALLVDGEAFSWYGSRMLHAATYLDDLAKTMQKTSHQN
ncbi:MAG: helical backbone metal receptor [Bacteroidetes bacterium]|jgi:ABC-type Fe3+-hydroxamate transport system substrate-binding protein|nr:helical backbone metal receptor [Bacteroidota bacterium]